LGTLIGYYGFIDRAGKGYLINNLGDVCTQPPYLDWLLFNFAGQDYKKVCYDLDYFSSVLFRLIGLTKEEATHLSDKGKLHDPPYDLTYIPSKYLGITKGTGWGRPYAGFFDISQYMNTPTLELEPSIGDCVKKAISARDIGAEVSRTLHKLGLDGNTLTSPIRSMEKSILATLDLPSHLDVPPEVNNLALRSCKGNWVEAFQLGAWLDSSCYDLDISGAYGSMLAKLYDTRRGRWVRSQERPLEAMYGFAECLVDITASFSPILWSNQNENGEPRFNLSPIGPREDVLLLSQMDFIDAYKQGKYEIIDSGWWWLPTGKPPYTDAGYQPLKGTINWLWGKRKTETPLEKKILKRCLAGLWGRTLSMRGKEYAPSFFPVWGALVEANTSLAVARFCLDNALSPLHIAVDGVIVDKPVALPQSDALGSWRISHVGNAIVVSSGVCAVEGKTGAEEFALNYEWLKSALEAKPRAKEYRMVKVSPYTLAKALNTDFKRLGEVEEITRSIVIGEEAKRLYPKLPKCGGDLLKNHYPSEPIDISMAICLTEQEVK
jgi:hypothetical protein